MSPCRILGVMENTDHRTIAVEQFNRCWDFLEQASMTAADEAELLTAAFTSRFHWQFVGTEKNFMISDWMVSRAAAATGFGDMAIRFALAANERAATFEITDWMEASNAEGLARAYASAGMVAERDEWIARAAALVAVISDPKEKELIGSQLATVPRS